LAPILSKIELEVRTEILRERIMIFSPLPGLTSAVDADPLSDTRHSMNSPNAGTRSG